MDSPIVSGSGIRGVFGSSFKVTDAMAFAAAFGRLAGAGQVIVGRDTRASGPAVEAAVVAGLCSVGCDPVLLGICPTPTIQIEVVRNRAKGGIAITSSHNPGDWNALKLIGPDGVFLRAAARRRLLELFGAPGGWAGSAGCGRPQEIGGSVLRHADLVASNPLFRCDGRPMRAVLDVTGGTGALLGPALMDLMGVQYSVVNPSMNPDGSFPRVAEPLPANLSALSRAVVETRADVGFAFDPDGDRLALVDDRGRIPGEEYTVALAVDYILPRRPSPVVVNLSTSTLVDACASRHGAKVSRAPVGEVNVVEQMEIEGALTGGEGNGGVIDREFHAGRDSAVAMACVISLLRERECRLSEWIDGLPPLHMVKLKYELSRPFEEIAGFLAGTLGPPTDVRDGVRYEKPGGWAHLRPSGTEPVVRFIAQDSDPAELDRLVSALAGIAGEPCVE